MIENGLIESLMRYVGQTVTIWTESGGLSGSGFTGALVAVYGGTVRLITNIGAPPSCPIGSCCTGPVGNFGVGGMGYGYNPVGVGAFGGTYGGPFYGSGFDGTCNPCNFLGSITEIPIDRIVSFTHNAIS